MIELKQIQDNWLTTAPADLVEATPRAIELFDSATFDPDTEVWRQMFAYGETIHPKLDYKVDADFCESMIESFNYMRDEYGYFPPICVEHQFDFELDDLGKLEQLDAQPVSDITGWSEGADALIQAVIDRTGKVSRGLQWGFVNALKHKTTGEDAGLWARPIYNRSAALLHALGLLVYVSPAFYPTVKEPHKRGKTLRNVLRELTHCDIPFQWNLKTPVNNALSSQADEMEKIEELLEALRAAVEGMAGAQTEMMQKLEAMGEEPPELTDDERTEMSARIKALEAEAKTAAAIPEIMAELSVDAQEARRLAPLKLSAETSAAYDALRERLAATPDQTQMRGQSGAPAPADDDDDPADESKARQVAELAAKAAASGVERAEARTFIVANGKGITEQDCSFSIIDHAYRGRIH